MDNTLLPPSLTIAHTSSSLPVITIPGETEDSAPLKSLLQPGPSKDRSRASSVSTSNGPQFTGSSLSILTNTNAIANYTSSNNPLNTFYQKAINPLEQKANSSTSASDSSKPEDSWKILCVKILPLFNGEGLRGPVEDLNELTRRCIHNTILSTLFDDINELLATGMLTLNSKLSGVSDEKLVPRLVELWSFFFGTVLPYFEGVFLPLQLEIKNYTLAMKTMDARTMGLTSFRDHVISPLTDRLKAAIHNMFAERQFSDSSLIDMGSRMLQMTSILGNRFSSDDGRQRDIDPALGGLKSDLLHLIKGLQREMEATPVPRSIFE